MLSGSLLSQCPLPHDERVGSSQCHQNQPAAREVQAMAILLVNWELPGVCRGSRPAGAGTGFMFRDIIRTGHISQKKEKGIKE